MNKEKYMQKKMVGPGNAVLAFLKCFVTLWAFSGDSLSLMLSGYSMSVPIVKYFVTVLDSLDGWGIETMFMAAGLGAVYYLVRDRQKSPWVSGLSAFFALSTVIGISYSKTSSWDCIFLFKLQFALALFVALGYYFAYKNCILFVSYLFEQRPKWLRRDVSGGAIESFLFQKRPFLGPFLFILVLALPWLISFFPGTLQWDAHAQLWIFWGEPSAVAGAGNHPVIATQIMGGCVWLGRNLFHSDTVGLFFYNITQFMVQCLTFAYACFLLGKMKAPALMRWMALLYWTVYPFFPIWGYTMVKDTPFYIFILLHVVTLMDIVWTREKDVKCWKTGLLMISAVGTVIFRNDGVYVILITLLFALVLYRKYWKIYLTGIVLCLLLVFVIKNIYMPYHKIAKGNTGDMLSVPLQQTARYLREHPDEVTEDEAAVLQEGFSVELETIGQLYNPVCSDPVKAYFRPDLDSDYLKSYFRVWSQQFRKHPDTYIQAFLNHIYGYFYPNQHDYLYDSLHVTAYFYIGNTDKWHDGYLDIEFGISNDWGRQVLQNLFYLVEKMPIFSMFTSAGLHTYILLGECVYLLARKKRREILFLIPGVFVLFLRLFSPVNGCVRYIIPIMVVLPVTAAWCYIVTHSGDHQTARDGYDMPVYEENGGEFG